MPMDGRLCTGADYRSSFACRQSDTDAEICIALNQTREFLSCASYAQA